MSTLTSRLKLLKAALSDPANYITSVADAFDKLDAAAGLTLCTSTTRPSSPYVGQWIMETDTGRRAAWDGTGWRCTSGGSAVVTVTAFGDFSFSGLGFSSWFWFNMCNGDSGARANLVVAKQNAYPGGPGTPYGKCWLGNTGATGSAGAARFEWTGEGYLL